LGIRYQDLAVGDLTSVVAGMQGVAPYRFEIDAALFLSEDGDISGRAEFERDYLFSEKLILQPRAEINIAFQDVPELAISSGVNELALELRLRYEITRKFAPYIGLSYERAHGDTARALNAAGESSSDTTLLAGMRFWF
jgi:copper resistance protein B